VRDASGLVAGDPSLPALQPGECAVSGDVHACAVTAGPHTLIIGASSARARAIEPLFAWGAALGILLGSLAGALASTMIARWALRPLARLRARIDAIDADAPSSEALSPPAEHAEIEALRAAIADLVDRLGAALASAQRFALDAAHELRTPLTAIAGELDLLAESDAPDPAALARVRASTGELVALVERLLVLAAPPVGATSPREAVDLADIASEVRASLGPAAERVALDAAEDVLVRGDPVLLRVALGNAVDNALKFSEGPVRVRIFAEGDEAHVEVQDEGRGVAPAERARVFEPFYRSAHARAATRGHGLGLAIIAHAVAAHGGRARFADVARGAKLCIVLPRWRELP
jgi:two-component system sensor histidine kinase MprB